MKESKIKIYVENAEVPEYKSSGASGFDVQYKVYPESILVSAEYGKVN